MTTGGSIHGKGGVPIDAMIKRGIIFANNGITKCWPVNILVLILYMPPRFPCFVNFGDESNVSRL